MEYPGSDFKEPEGLKGASVRGPLPETAPTGWLRSRTTWADDLVGFLWRREERKIWVYRQAWVDLKRIWDSGGAAVCPGVTPLTGCLQSR